MKRFIALLAALVLSACAMSACTVSISSGNSSVQSEVQSTGESTVSLVSEDESKVESKVESKIESEVKSEVESEVESEAESEAESENESKAEISKDPVPTNSGTGSAEDLFTWKIKLEGKEYTIPCDYSEFKKDGWTLEDEDAKLNSTTYTLIEYISKGDSTLPVQLWNPTDSALKYSECQIGKIDLAVENNVSVELPGGFVFDKNVTADDVIAFYGEPTSEDEGDNYRALYYEYDIYNEVEFFIYDDEDMVDYNNVSIQNLV